MLKRFSPTAPFPWAGAEIKDQKSEAGGTIKVKIKKPSGSAEWIRLPIGLYKEYREHSESAAGG